MPTGAESAVTAADGVRVRVEGELPGREALAQVLGQHPDHRFLAQVGGRLDSTVESWRFEKEISTGFSDREAALHCSLKLVETSVCLGSEARAPCLVNETSWSPACTSSSIFASLWLSSKSESVARSTEPFAFRIDFTTCTSPPKCTRLAR